MFKLSNTERARMRKLYEEKIASLYNIKREYFEWRTREWVDETIATLERVAQDPDSTARTAEDHILSQKYEVDIDDGKKILRIKRGVETDVSCRILAMDEYFDVLCEAHVQTGHSARIKMQEYLRGTMKVYVPRTAVVWFLKFCKVCQAMLLQPTKRTVCATKKKRDNHGFIELLDMRQNPDKEFVYIMHFVDMTSNFTFLRPLTSPRAGEIADELLKIFLEIGCPGIIHTPVDSAFNESIIREIKEAWPTIDIIPGARMKSRKKIDGIENKVVTWMMETKSGEWSKGVWHVQYQMNIMKTDGTKHTPFKSLIGMNPKKGLSTRGLKTVLSSLKFEEDLQKIVHLDKVFSSEESSGDEASGDKEQAAVARSTIMISPSAMHIHKSNDTTLIVDTKTGDTNLPGPSRQQTTIQDSIQSKPIVNQEGPLPICQARGKPARTYKRRAQPQKPNSGCVLPIKIQKKSDISTKEKKEINKNIKPEPIKIKKEVDKSIKPELFKIKKEIDENSMLEPIKIKTETDKSIKPKPVKVKKEIDKSTQPKPIKIKKGTDKSTKSEPIKIKVEIDKSPPEHDVTKTSDIEMTEDSPTSDSIKRQKVSQVSDTNNLKSVKKTYERKKNQENLNAALKNINKTSEKMVTTLENQYYTTLKLPLKLDMTHSKQRAKECKMWNSEQIDLPLPSDPAESKPIGQVAIDPLTMEIEKSADFGEIPKVVLPLSQSVATLPSIKIVKTESLAKKK